MNRPKRYISRDSLDEDTVAFDVWEWYFREAEQPWVAERIVTLEHDVMQLRRMPPSTISGKASDMTSSVPSMQITGVSGRMNFMMCWMNYRKVQEAMKIMTDGLRTSRITPGNWNACTRARKSRVRA